MPRPVAARESGVRVWRCASSHTPTCPSTRWCRRRRVKSSRPAGRAASLAVQGGLPNVRSRSRRAGAVPNSFGRARSLGEGLLADVATGRAGAYIPAGGRRSYTERPGSSALNYPADASGPRSDARLRSPITQLRTFGALSSSASSPTFSSPPCLLRAAALRLLAAAVVSPYVPAARNRRAGAPTRPSCRVSCGLRRRRAPARRTRSASPDMRKSRPIQRRRRRTRQALRSRRSRNQGRRSACLVRLTGRRGTTGR